MTTSTIRRVTAALGALAVAAGAALVTVAPAQAVTLPGNIDTAQARSLTVHKYALGPNSPQAMGTGQQLPAGTNLGTPLPGAVFTATQVAGIDLSTSAGWAEAGNLTPQTAANRLTTSVFTSTPSSTTGLATFPSDMPIALFYVQETVLPEDATNPTAPFLVTLPFPTGPSGAPANQWIYDVHVYPKNAVTELTKTRVAPPANSAEARNPDLVRWAIAASIPTLAAGDGIDSFVLTDNIPTSLEYVPTPPTGVLPTNVVVTPAGNNLPQTFLEGTDYTIDTTAGSQTLTFTPTGRTKLAGLQGGLVTFNVLTRAVSIPPSGSIVNSATANINGATETVTGTTPIGQLTVYAYEGANVNARTPLEGAVYRVFLTQQDADRNENPVLIDGVSSWTTGADGYVEIPIITPGTYYVRELTAPTGFQLPTPDRIATQVVAGETSIVAPVRNYVEFAHNQVIPAFMLPLTGGDGAVWFGVGGASLMLLAIGAAIVVTRRRASAAQPIA